MKPIYIIASESISAIGHEKSEIWKNYLSLNHFFKLNNKQEWVCLLNQQAEHQIEILKNSDLQKKRLDKTVLMILLLGKKLTETAHWQNKKNIGINIGSSRGATQIFENDFNHFLQTGTSKTHTSPLTTLGNISSWLAQELGLNGPEISHSITCSSGLHALLNGIAWLQSGMSKRFIIGASEAPLTDFTIAQMKALKIYSKSTSDFPCESMNFDKKQNSMVLSEGAILMALTQKKPENYLGKMTGFGYGIEPLNSPTALSDDGICLQKSMKMALKNHDYKSIDAIVMHAPGTIKGDLSELNAIKAVFGNNLPLLTSNKWKMGHTFGASGLFSLDMALMMFKNQMFIENPFYRNENRQKSLRKILINAVGFGGNAVSVLVEK